MKKIKYVPFLILAAIAGTTMTACSKSDSGYGSYNNNSGSGNAVSMKGMGFSIGTLTVNAGTKVTWTNNDAVTHTVTADDASFDSGDIAPGNTYSHTFATTGTFNYHCKIHTMMTASVIVK